MKAVLQYRASQGFQKRISETVPDWLNVLVIDEAQKKTFGAEIADADVLLHVLEVVTAEVIADASSLRLIQKIGVGVNTIDLDAARSHDVAVCNMPGANSRAVAEMTLTLMLAALRRIPYFDARTRQGSLQLSLIHI